MLANKDLGGWKDRLNKVIPFLWGKTLDSKNQFEGLNSGPLNLAPAIALPSCQLCQEESLYAWVRLYLKTQVSGAPLKTQQAKRRDLEQFTRFYVDTTGSDDLDAWTPAMTKHFQESMVKTISAVTSKPYSHTTINRMMATLRHFGRWVQQQRPLLMGNPFIGIRDKRVEEPVWNGLAAEQINVLKTACEERIRACKRSNQNPYLEAAIFYLLLQTGLRESELVALNIGQYHSQGLHQVIRHKNRRVNSRVPVPAEARRHVEQYLKARGEIDENAPLFLSRYGNRFSAQDVRRICQRLLKQANFLEEKEGFRFTPHMLRHTFLKRATDKYGVHFAQQMSGNISIREIFRYAKPNQLEIDSAVEKLFL